MSVISSFLSGVHGLGASVTIGDIEFDAGPADMTFIAATSTKSTPSRSGPSRDHRPATPPSVPTDERLSPAMDWFTGDRRAPPLLGAAREPDDLRRLLR